MHHAELNEKQLALEKIRDLLRSNEGTCQAPSNSFLLELHNNLSGLVSDYPETAGSPLVKKAQELLEGLDGKLSSRPFIRKYRRKENRKKRLESLKLTDELEPVKEKNEDLLNSKLMYKGSFGSGKRR